jgi:SSS family solute:Na+ symporter
MPMIIVLPGIAALLLAPDLAKPDEAYPTMMRLLPTGLLGLVFAALVAAIIASTASKINSIATIFTLDLYAKYHGAPTAAEDERAGDERHLVLVGRVAAVASIIVAIIAAKPLVGASEQAFQFIQEFTGFFTPGITVIFLVGLFWKRGNEAGALTAAIASVVLSYLMKVAAPSIPFMNRMGIVFLIALALCVVVSLATKDDPAKDTIETGDVRSATRTGFNVGAIGVILILVALYATWW